MAFLLVVHVNTHLRYVSRKLVGICKYVFLNYFPSPHSHNYRQYYCCISYHLLGYHSPSLIFHLIVHEIHLTSEDFNLHLEHIFLKLSLSADMLSCLFSVILHLPICPIFCLQYQYFNPHLEHQGQFQLVLSLQ
jgi:hypothetical protein